MKYKIEMDTTTCNRVYKHAYKIFLEGEGKLYCSICPYHKGENWGPKRSKSWKDTTKRQKQWKVKD